jgi:hypothetical protein
MLTDYYDTENFVDFQLQSVNTPNIYRGVNMNPENRILKIGKAELQSIQWFTLYSISTKRFSKLVGLKDVMLSIPRQHMSL